ncbi:MAG: 30S ribosomal protein S2 [Acidobacteriota bacterium]|nr:30S ribosomal protein S2 [Acidobacteriota bacterium]
MSSIPIKQLLDAGVHFGHQTRRWNPKMKPFIFGQRNGIHIVDLRTTLRYFKRAIDFLVERSIRGSSVLFVGTKRQAQDTIEREAERCEAHYVNNRWLGGLLTNFATVRNSIKRYKDLEEKRVNGFYDKLSKKEVARLERERKKLDKNLRGIRDMERLPDILFVVDTNREVIAVKEAAKLGIPVIAVVDTNSDPDDVDFVIPGNDDALRSVRLFTSTIADAILAGKAIREARLAEAREKAAREKAAREKAAREKAARERALREKVLQEKAAQEQAAQQTSTPPDAAVAATPAPAVPAATAPTSE